MASKPPDKNKCECNFACLPNESGAVLIQARWGKTKGLASAAGAHGTNARLSVTRRLLGDLTTACLACRTAGDRPGGRRLDMTGWSSVWSLGGCTGCGPCAGSVWQPLHNVRPPNCATCSSSHVDSRACDCMQPEEQLPLRATERQIDNAGVLSDMTAHLLEG